MKKYIVPVLLLLLMLYPMIKKAPGTRGDGDWDLTQFRRLPVLHGGRLKPIDTVARTTLLLIHEKQSLKVDGEHMSAARWMLDAMTHPEDADGYKIFRIVNPNVLGMIGAKKEESLSFSFDALRPYLSEIQQEANAARSKEVALQTQRERAILKLEKRLNLYYQLKNSLQPQDAGQLFPEEIRTFEHSIAPGLTAAQAIRSGQQGDNEAMQTLKMFMDRYIDLNQFSLLAVLPPQDTSRLADDWDTMGEGLQLRIEDGSLHPLIPAWANVLQAYGKKEPSRFHEAVSSIFDHVKPDHSQVVAVAGYEDLYNRLQVFPNSMALYIASFLLVFLSWLVWQEPLNRCAFVLLLGAFTLHSMGLFMRVYLQGRPPVTNLYSSAVFVGIIAVALGVVLEWFYRLGIGTMVASGIGFMTLIIAHHLSLTGDTMEMMRAVLDSNFWLGTHVITISIGYSATFLAGMLATIYLIRGIFTRSLDEDSARAITRMVYGIVCFATFFSFVGTVLGGIWADQSWGRFWGWDPKENGALLIVIWNAIILHSRWGGLVKQRGLMCLAVFGNIVTSWSWFGVNMLGVGLHSYGFMDSAFKWLVLFCSINMLIILLAMLPRSLWRSKPAQPASP